MKKRAALAAFVILTASSFACVVSAQASLVIGTGNPGGQHENVLFGNGVSGNLLSAFTNQSNTEVVFHGLETLSSPSSGQARITGS